MGKLIKLIKTMLCWRVLALGMMGAASLLLLLCEAEGVLLTIAVKAAGLAFMAATNLLFVRWDAHGRLGDLAELLGEDDE